MTPDGQMIYAGGIFISFFLFVLLLGKRRKNAADRVLSAWLLLALIHQAFIGWYASGRWSAIPALVGWELPFPFVHGPFLYLYLLSLTGRPGMPRRWALHFIPAVIVAGILAVVLPQMPLSEKLGNPVASRFEPLFRYIVYGIMLSGLVYVGASLVLLSRHRKNIKRLFSNTEKITLNWMRYLIGGMGLIWTVVVLYPSAQALYLAVTLFIFFIGYFGIRQVGIFSDLQLPEETYAPELPGDRAIELAPVAVPVTEPVATGTITETSTSMVMQETGEEPLFPDQEQAGPAVAAEPVTIKIKYEKNRLADTEAGRIHLALGVLMQQQQLYKDPELTLGDLATALDLQPGLVSQVINTREGKSFYDYVNALRVSAFQELLLQPGSGQYTLLSLAFECGFNSKTSFNRNFKKITGMSPRDYANQYAGDMPGEDQA